MPPAATARFSRARATRTSFALASARNRCSGERPNAAGAGAPLTLTRRRLYEEPRLRAEARRKDGKGLFRTPGSVHAAAREYLFLVHAPFFGFTRAREYQIAPDFATECLAGRTRPDRPLLNQLAFRRNRILRTHTLQRDSPANARPNLRTLRAGLSMRTSA
jgi:hypothetical protein